jgi:hypothetical protein
MKYDLDLVCSHFKLNTCHLFIFLNNSTKNEIILGTKMFHHNDRQYPFKKHLLRVNIRQRLGAALP